METAGLWMHAWDVWSDGTDEVMAFARDAGLTTLYPASSYHAGWFIHPHSRGRRVWMAEDGVIYFHPDESVWARCRLQPMVATIARETDWFAEIAERLDEYGLNLSSWTICCHNTGLGRLHPEITVQNCFGDSYPHALNPSHADVRAYLTAMVRNLAQAYPLRSIQLESPQYLGFRHGHHHERYSVPLDPVALRLFDLSFAASDLAMVQAAGIDGPGLRAVVARRLQDYLDQAPAKPADWPASWEEACSQIPDLRKYHNAQATIVEGLRENCRQAVDGTGVRLEGLGYGSQYDLITIACYGLSADQIAARVPQLRQQMEPQQQLQIGLRVGFGDVPSQTALGEMVDAADEAGVDGVLFYNYSEMSATNLSWIAPAVEGHVRR